MGYGFQQKHVHIEYKSFLLDKTCAQSIPKKATIPKLRNVGTHTHTFHHSLRLSVRPSVSVTSIRFSSVNSSNRPLIHVSRHGSAESRTPWTPWIISNSQTAAQSGLSRLCREPLSKPCVGSFMTPNDRPCDSAVFIARCDFRTSLSSLLLQMSSSCSPGRPFPVPFPVLK